MKVVDFTVKYILHILILTTYIRHTWLSVMPIKLSCDIETKPGRNPTSCESFQYITGTLTAYLHLVF